MIAMPRGKTFLLFTKSKVKIGTVIPGEKPKIISSSEFDWTTETLYDALSEIKKNILGEVGLILSDDLVYTTIFSVSDKEKISRSSVAKRITKEIPESIAETPWDYREVRLVSGEREIIVFVPIKSFWDIISGALKESGIKTTSTEPVSAAAMRHSDLFVGAALKPDLEGVDEDVLNIVLPETAGRRNNVLIILLVLATILSALAVIYFLRTKKVEPPSSRIPETIPAEIPALPTEMTPVEEPAREGESIIQETVTEKTAVVDKGRLTVTVLNGTKVTGAAGKLAVILKEKGYGTITTGNAEMGYQVTTLRTKELLKDFVPDFLSDIRDYYPHSTLGDGLPETDAADIILIIGDK